jgi:hypothetical protein
LQHEGALTVAGYSIDYLSPWGELWDGSSLSVRLKHYFPGQFIVVLNGNIFDKSYLDVVEYSSSSEDEYWFNSRYDKHYSLQTSLSKAITIGSGRSLIPSLNVGYLYNSSTNDFYDFNAVSVSLTVNIPL